LLITDIFQGLKKYKCKQVTVTVCMKWVVQKTQRSGRADDGC